MSTDTPLPDDEDREHATEPAEGTADTDGADVREHSTEPAEGKDI